MSDEKQAVQPEPKGQETAKSNGGAFEENRMNAWVEEQQLFDFKEPAQSVTPKTSPEAYRILKVDGKEVPVKSEEELISLAQKGVDYTQKRQRDAEWERDLKQQEELLKRLEGPLNLLAEQVKAGKNLAGEPEENPFGNPDEEISDPAAQAKIKNLEEKLQEHEKTVSQVNREMQMRKMAQIAQDLQIQYDAARKEFPFEDISQEGEQMKTSDLMFAGYLSALEKKERIRAQNESGYEPRPMPELIRQAAKDFNFLQSKLRSNPSLSLSLDEIRKSRPDLYEKIKEEAVREYANIRASNPMIVKPSEGEARTSRGNPSQVGKTLSESLSDAMNDPDLATMLDEFSKDGHDIRKYGLK